MRYDDFQRIVVSPKIRLI